MMSRRVHVVMIGLLVLWVLVMLAVGLAAVGVARADDGAQVAARTVTVSVPRNGILAVYPVAGHSVAEIKWRCSNVRAWRTAIDWGWQPACTRIVITSKIWFTYEIRVPGRNL